MYKTIILNPGIAEREYFAENLNYGTMVNGSANQSNDGVVEKYCYNDDPANCAKYGGLYQWAEAMDLPSACNSNKTGSANCPSTLTLPPPPYTATDVTARQHQGLCPTGWHIINASDWNVTDPGAQHGGRIESATAWSGSNLTGFSAVPGGVRMNTTGTFDLIGKSVWWWSSLEGSATTGGCEKLATADAGVSSCGMSKELGFALRCVHDWTL